MSAEFVLPSDFWSHFVTHCWGKIPFVIKKPFPQPLATTQEVFLATRHAADEFRAGGSSVRIRFYMEDGFSVKPEPYLPDSNDHSAEAYAARVTGKIDGRCFGLILNGFQAYDAELWRRVREFLRGLLTEISVQPMVEGVLFFGNYDKTPRGIHKDPVDIFLFVIEGRKKMYLWPEEFFHEGDHDARLDSDFAVLRRDAIVLEGEPGDVIYWPSSYWHVGESVGGLSLSLSLALKPLQPSSEILDHLKQYIEEFVHASLDEGNFPTTPKELEESAAMIAGVTKLALKALQKANRDSDFAEAIQVSWLDRLTASVTYHRTTLENVIWANTVGWGHNAEGGGGYQSLVSATVHSVNIVYSQLMRDLGPKQVAETAHLLGITSKLPLHCSMVLGADDVTPLELTSAYATIAAGGVYHRPRTIRRVEDATGKIVASKVFRVQAKRVVSDGVAYEATQILKDAVSSGTGTRARLDDGRPQAGKTGTAENYGNAWFCGYTPDIAACVWVGYRSSNKPLENVEGFGAVYGGTLPAMIWKDFMTTALARIGPHDWPEPKHPMVYRPFTPTTSFGYNPSPPAAPQAPEKKPAKKKPKAPPAATTPVVIAPQG